MVERPLKDTFTSTGAKFFAHEEAMRGLRAGRARCVVTHLMPTDICQHTCAFCSVQTREGNVLRLADMLAYVDILRGYGLKSVILSGGGNPLLYRDREGGAGISDLIYALAERGLDIGMITNGMKLRDYHGRRSYATLEPEALDCLTWLRISMAGLDHPERRVEVPDVDEARTTLGFSYVYHDIYDCPEEPNHGKVSTVADLLRFANVPNAAVRTRQTSGEERLPWLEEQIGQYVKRYQPRYVRLLPNCFERDLIADRCRTLQDVANRIDPSVVFVQHKPPCAPKACYLGYIHPVLNSDGYVYPCDSNVLNAEVLGAGEHKFGQPWRLCRWDHVAELYESPVRSLVDPQALCPGCVFTESNRLLQSVVDGTADLTPPSITPEHVNFV